MVINPIGDKSEVFSDVFTTSSASWGEGSEGSTGTDGAGSGVVTWAEKFPLSSIWLSSYVLSWSLGSAASRTGGVSFGSVMESLGPSNARGATIVTVPSKMASPM